MALVVKNLPTNAGDSGDVGLIPWGRKWQLTPVFLPRKFHGQKRLAGYSPWSHKQSDTAEHAHVCTHTHTHTISHKRWELRTDHWNGQLGITDAFDKSYFTGNLDTRTLLEWVQDRMRGEVRVRVLKNFFEEYWWKGGQESREVAEGNMEVLFAWVYMLMKVI